MQEKAAQWATYEKGNMVQRLIQNYDEDCGFADFLDRFSRMEFAKMNTIPVCKTPYVLGLGGANLERDIIINPSTILKCMSTPVERFHGHNLDKDIFKYLIFELRNPAMLLKGSKENTLVAVTDLMDREGRPIIVSVALERRNAHHLANQITSAYGRNDFDEYLRRQVEKGNLIAINKNKANQMFQSAGVQFPLEETLICFDNSIAYTFENVKVLSIENYEKKHNVPENDSKKLEDSIDALVDDARSRIYSGDRVAGKEDSLDLS